MSATEEEEEEPLREIEEATARINSTIDRVTKQTYQAIGSAITLWSRMEGSLVHIASWLMDAESNKVGLVFYSINNFHTWLSIIDELFAIDPAFSPLKSDWNEIANKLRGLNDIRVRLAHHALEEGKDPFDVAEDEFDVDDAFPTLRPNRVDVRAKWKKKAIGLDEIFTFQREVLAVVEKLTSLMHRIIPIYVGPKRRLVANIKELQRKAALLDAQGNTQPPADPPSPS
jgi:hypothetical protein